MATVRRNLNELGPEALRAELAPLKLPDYRVRQLEKWLARGVSFD